MSENIATRDAIVDSIIELAEYNDKILVLDADLAGPTKVVRFEERYPDRFYQMGVSEQNMIGAAAGLASFGFIPFTSTFACFAAKRACDQIRIVVAQPGMNVKIMGAYAGLFTGKTGKTHQSVQDIAIMRSMPNMVVTEAGDATESHKMIEALTDYDGPVYIRSTRDPVPRIFDERYSFKIGKAVQVREGSDVLIVSSGYMLHIALKVAEELDQLDINAGLVNVSTLKPFDSELICNLASKVKGVVTIENHNIIGGLGSAVAEALSEGYPQHLLRIGIQDTFGESADNESLAKKYGLDSDSMKTRIKQFLDRIA